MARDLLFSSAALGDLALSHMLITYSQEIVRGKHKHLPHLLVRLSTKIDRQ